MSITSRMSFSARLGTGFAALLASMAALGGWGWVQFHRIGAAAAQADQAAQASWVLLAAVGVITAGFGLFCWALASGLRGRVAEATTVAQRIASGDLGQSVEATGADEIAVLLRELSTMRESLHRVVTQVRESADSIQLASSEVASGNTDLSNRTEQTASRLQETASSISQLTSTVAQSADAARQANQLATSAAEVAARGGQVVTQVVSTMDAINTSSKKIADIISVIDGIAFQTNILALNAAVEAARAGEQGRGFAVVAGEVRALAQRSAEAAKEIKTLIGASVDKVEIGSQLVADAGATMNDIVASVQRVTDIIGEITAATTEQSNGISQVNSAVTQLDQMTQQNAALVEQSAAAAASMKEQAGALAGTVREFKLAGGQTSAAAPAAAKPAARAPIAEKAIAAAAASSRAAVKRETPKTAKPTPAATKRAAPPAAAKPAPAAEPPVANAAVAAAAAPAGDGDWETF